MLRTEADAEITMNAQTPLLACPFCGNDSILVYNVTDHVTGRTAYWTVMCSGNGCGAEISGNSTRAAAITTWNERMPASGGETCRSES